MRGTYIFKEDGKEIYRCSNVITKFGARFLTNLIAGNVDNQRKDLAFGIDRGESLVTGASASAGTITYTAINSYSAGDVVSIYGLKNVDQSNSNFNLSNVTVASATSSQFTVTNAATGTTIVGSTTGRAFKKAKDLDTRLGFEFYRLPVSFGTTDIQTTSGVTDYSVVYKAVIPQDIVGEISEVGLYPGTRTSTNNYDSKFISDFSDVLSWEDSLGNNPQNTESNYKIGGNLLNMSSNSGSAREYKSSISPIDLSGYSTADTLKLAFYKEDNNLQSIKVRLYSDITKYYEVTITPQSGIGYKITSDITLASLFNGAVNSPDNTNINMVGIVLTPTSGNTTTVGMDGLRINDEDTFDPTFGIISRSTLGTPLSKLAGRQVEIEYRLDLDF